jgi:DNA-binding SARP family transcriptional activator
MKNAPPRLSLRLFGGFVLAHDPHAGELSYEKGRALLAYLAVVPDRVCSRAFLAAMFWPDLPREAALTNLRQVLHDLRQKLKGLGSPLLVDREYVRFDPVAELDIDTAGFSTALTLCPSVPSVALCKACLAGMEKRAALYRGEFMAGFSLPDCPDFEEWLQIQRETLHLRALGLLIRLSDCYEQMGCYAKSLPFASRALELEPWNEDGLLRAMRLYARNGESEVALSQYAASCEVLKRELGVLPSEEARALADRIRGGEFFAAHTPVPGVAINLPMPAAERRQVTVLYCELAATGVEDPDEALNLLRGPQARCSEIIRSHAGFVVQVRGGSLLAYFGYPQASEHAAQIAVQAALAMTRTKFTGLDLRAGVHTGVVISGDLLVPDATGATSGMAIRLRQIVDPGEVAISAATQRLVAGYFDCTSLGLRQLRGIARPLEAFRVERESGAQGRLEASDRLTSLVGRVEEIAVLLAMWKKVRRGERQIVLLLGDAGVGKSRLVLTLREKLREQACAVRELRCSPEYRHSPLYPLAALYGTALGFSSEDSPATRFDLLANFVEIHYANSDPDTVPLLARMLSLPLRPPYREPVCSPQLQREKTLAIVLGRLRALAAHHPVLLVVEDLHWADPSTLEFLSLFIAQESAGPVFVVLTARSEFQPLWPESLTQTLTVPALDDMESAALVSAVVPEITPEMRSLIVKRADGIPLFAEELAKDIAHNDPSAIPPTLLDLLATRLDSMGGAKTIAQAAACVGREFDLDLLRRIVPIDSVTMMQLLRQLQNGGVLENEIDGVCRFRHALIRDAAYQSQTRDGREAVHRRIAVALKTAGGSIRAELLAQHWVAAGDAQEAVSCWLEAGQFANRNSASQEALAHFKAGLALLDRLPDEAGRARLEFFFQIGLGAAACAVQGYASIEGAVAYERAKELCSQMERHQDIFPAVWGLWAGASSRDGYAGAQVLAEQLLRMATQSGDPVQMQQSHFAVADTRYWQGEFAVARKHLEQVRAGYKPVHHASHLAGFGEDAGVTSAAYLSWVLWFLGFPDQARRVSVQSVVLARQLDHPFSLAYALTFATILRCRLQEPGEALVLAQETQLLADIHGFPLWQIGARLARGWVLAMQNRREGIETLQQCVEATQAAMGGVTLIVLGPLADACVRLEAFDEACSVCDQALVTGSAIMDRHIEAELHRLRGEAMLGQENGREAEAEAHFNEALLISRRQQAKSLELRAAVSMARLWQRQGKRDDAHRLLEGVYGWFTEGFDTPDLVLSRELLSDLSAACRT